MNTATKNKLLVWLVVLLLLANAATIAMFWIGRGKHPPRPKETPKEFLIRELKLDTKQQDQLDILVKEHRQQVDQLREKIKAAKDSLFDLVKQPGATDSVKQVAAAAVSKITERIDILTLDHFQKIRALCTPAQQDKFDEIIHEVTAMLGAPKPPLPGAGREGPPPGP